MELLAPAGGAESIEAAVRTGASAIYLGAKKFSARASADNFDEEELLSVINYCHERKVKVYLAINTIIFDEEMQEALETVKKATEMGIDAFIIQDLGLATLIKKHCPKARLHASTQMTVHSPSGAKLLYEMGFDRVVLSRELSKSEIKEIVDSCPIETEIFVHGALCMCVSGQCYFSAFVGQRSGNRGRCAQPCRLPYKNKNEVCYPLSLKDLSLVKYINEIKSLGVTSLKIEGRMKRPEYVAEAVSVYYNAIKGNEVYENYDNLRKVFSRTGFTDGYFCGKVNGEMFGYRKKEDVVSADNDLYKKIREKYNKELKKIPLNVFLSIKTGEKLTLKASDGEYEIALEGGICEKAIKSPLSKEKALSSIAKTGGTPFYINDFVFETDNLGTVSASELNDLRRKFTQKFYEKYKEVEEKPFKDIEIVFQNEQVIEKPLYKKMIFLNKPSFDTSLRDSLCFVPYNTDISALKKMKDNVLELGVYLPRCAFGIESKIEKVLENLTKIGINHILVGNLYGIYLGRKYNMIIHGDFSLNIANSFALEAYKKLGLVDVILSPELTFNQISKIRKILPFSIITYGKIPLMITRNCPNNAKGISCGVCKNRSVLTDRTNREFELRCFEGCTEIFNCVPLLVDDKRIKDLSLSFEYTRLAVESYDDIIKKHESIEKYKRIINKKTNGLYLRGVKI